MYPFRKEYTRKNRRAALKSLRRIARKAGRTAAFRRMQILTACCLGHETFALEVLKKEKNHAYGR